MRRVGRARRLQVCSRRLGRHLPSGLTAAEPSPTASRSIMYSKQIDNHAIGDSFFLNAFRTDPAPSAWRANPDSSTVSSTLSPGPSPWSHGAGVRTAGPAPKRPLPLGGLHPGKGRSSRQLCPALPGSGQGGGQGRGAPSACRAGARGRPGPRFLEQGGAAVPSGQRWTSEDPKAGSAPRPHPSRPPLAPCAGRPDPGIMLQPKRV